MTGVDLSACVDAVVAAGVDDVRGATVTATAAGAVAVTVHAASRADGVVHTYRSARHEAPEPAGLGADLREWARSRGLSAVTRPA